MDVVASLQHAIEIAGKLRALSKRIEDAEFKMLLADLSGELADAKLDLANLKVEMANLLSENQRLKQEVAGKGAQKPKMADGGYVFEGEDGHFCTACFDIKDKRVRLTPLPAPFSDMGKWQCPGCGAVLS